MSFFCFPLQVLGGVFSVDDLTGFEITKLIELPEPGGIVSAVVCASPSVFAFAHVCAPPSPAGGALGLPAAHCVCAGFQHH